MKHSGENENEIHRGFSAVSGIRKGLRSSLIWQSVRPCVGVCCVNENGCCYFVMEATTGC